MSTTIFFLIGALIFLTSDILNLDCELAAGTETEIIGVNYFAFGAFYCIFLSLITLLFVTVAGCLFAKLF